MTNNQLVDVQLSLRQLVNRLYSLTREMGGELWELEHQENVNPVKLRKLKAYHKQIMLLVETLDNGEKEARKMN